MHPARDGRHEQVDTVSMGKHEPANGMAVHVLSRLGCAAAAR